MSQDFEFETRLRLALREAAERTQHRSLAGRAIAAAPSLTATAGTAMAVIATLAVAAIFAVTLHRSASPLAPPQVVARLQLADSLGGGTTAAFGSVWLDDTTRDQLIRVDARTRHVVARLPVHGDVVSAAAAGALWVLEGGHGLDFTGPLLRIDPRTNRVTARVPLRTPAGKPFNAAAGGLLGTTQDVWVYGQSGALHIDPRRTATYAITTSAPPDSLASLGGDLWSHHRQPPAAVRHNNRRAAITHTSHRAECDRPRSRRPSADRDRTRGTPPARRDRTRSMAHPAARRQLSQANDPGVLQRPVDPSRRSHLGPEHRPATRSPLGHRSRHRTRAHQLAAHRLRHNRDHLHRKRTVAPHGRRKGS